MIAHRRGRVIVIPDDVDPFPGRARRAIQLLPRAERPVIPAPPRIVREIEPCRIG